MADKAILLKRTNMIKFVVFFESFLLITLNLYGKEKLYDSSFALKGRIHGLNKTYIYISYKNCYGLSKLDSFYILKNKFEFSGCIKEPTNFKILKKKEIRSVSDPGFAEIYIEPGEGKLYLNKSNFKEFKIIGSKTQDEITVYNKRKARISREIDIVYQDLLKRKELNNVITDSIAISKNELKISNLQNTLNLLHQKATEYDVNFIKQNPTSFYSSELLFYNLSKLKIDTIKHLFNALSEIVKTGKNGKSVQLEIEKMSNTIIGKKAPDFNVVDFENSNIVLSSYFGKKYVLLDFWASWCVPCIGSFPHLKILYEKYRNDGLEIIGISQDIDLQAMGNTIRKYELNWKQCLFAKDLKSHFKGVLDPNDIINKYYIQGIPVKLLINKEGIIIGRWDGNSFENDASLEMLLKKVMGF